MFYFLLMGNHLDSCKEDITRLKNIFKKSYFFIDCYPLKVLSLYLNKINKDDVLFIYFSGHGKIIGKRIDYKMRLLSSWINPDYSYIDSYTIDKILSNINCKKIFLVSDTCHSGNFGDFYTGESPLIFIGSSDIIHKSYEYKSDNKTPVGILVYLFEKYYKEILYLNIDILPLVDKIYKEYKITKNPIVKTFNI